jgi:hypothetical protein
MERGGVERESWALFYEIICEKAPSVLLAIY